MKHFFYMFFVFFLTIGVFTNDVSAQVGCSANISESEFIEKCGLRQIISDFNIDEFKIEELQNSLNETLKDLVKLKTSIPVGLQTPTKSRILSIERQLVGTQSELNKLKSSVYNYKKRMYSRQTPKDSEV